MLLIIIMSIFLISGLIGVIFWCNWNHKMPDWVGKVVFPVFVIGAALVVVVVMIWATNIDALENNRTEYEELLIYLPVVEAADNEYVRFDYYQKVKDWNERFDSGMKMKDNIWIGNIVGDCFKGCGRINFYLDYGNEVVMSPPTGTP